MLIGEKVSHYGKIHAEIPCRNDYTTYIPKPTLDFDS